MACLVCGERSGTTAGLCLGCQSAMNRVQIGPGLTAWDVLMRVLREHRARWQENMRALSELKGPGTHSTPETPRPAICASREPPPMPKVLMTDEEIAEQEKKWERQSDSLSLADIEERMKRT